MKRDLDVIREILLQVESLGLNERVKYDSTYDSPEEIHNALLLLDARFIVSESQDTFRRRAISIARMTDSGHTFLDSIRDPSILSKVKQELLKVGGGASLNTIQTLANKFVLEGLGLGG